MTRAAHDAPTQLPVALRNKRCEGTFVPRGAIRARSNTHVDSSLSSIVHLARHWQRLGEEGSRRRRRRAAHRRHPGGHLADGVAELLGDAILDIVAEGRDRAAPHAEAALRWLREAAHPPPGVALHASDGAIYTGIVLVDRGRVVVMLAFRDDRSRETDRSPIPIHENMSGGSSYNDTRSSSTLWEHEHRGRDDDDERWRR